MPAPRMTRLALLVAPAFIGADAIAAFTPGQVQESADPSGWGFAGLVASFDTSLNGGYNFNSTSGYSEEFLGTVIDRTDIVSEVYRFSQAHTFTTTLPTGGTNTFTVPVNGLAFAYRVRLVGASASTVPSLTELQVAGAPLFGLGQDVMAQSLLLGRGLVLGSYNQPDPTIAIPTGDDVFGSKVDFRWPGLSDLTQLDNNQTAVLLVFTDPAAIGQGVMTLTAPAGQGPFTGVVPNTGIAGDTAPPILIPIVPGPGSLALGAIAVGFLSRGRRRR